jgi:hypothetical protein
MEKLFYKVIILSIAIILTCCEKEKDTFQISMLKKSWTHSYEENTSENYDIYRPSDYKIFPASHFRHVFYFKDNNVCDYLVLAPDDAHYMEEGIWEFNEKTNIIRVMNMESDILFKLEIIELSDDLLKLKKI